MAASTAKSKPSPERIFNTMVAFQETEALKAAIELDIFTAIAEGANTAESLAGKSGTAGETGDHTKAHEEVWLNFARSMAPLTIPAAEFIAGLSGAAEAKPSKVLDIAAGHGMYGITVARRNPRAEIVAVDWPGVLEVA